MNNQYDSTISVNKELIVFLYSLLAQIVLGTKPNNTEGLYELSF